MSYGCHLGLRTSVMDSQWRNVLSCSFLVRKVKFALIILFRPPNSRASTQPPWFNSCPSPVMSHRDLYQVSEQGGGEGELQAKCLKAKRINELEAGKLWKEIYNFSSILKFFVRSWCTIVHQIRWHRRCKYFSKAICAMIFKPNAWSYKCLRPGLISMMESSRTKPLTSLEMLVQVGEIFQ